MSVIQYNMALDEKRDASAKAEIERSEELERRVKEAWERHYGRKRAPLDDICPDCGLIHTKTDKGLPRAIRPQAVKRNT